VNIIETPLAGVVIIEPRVFGDARGFFIESFQDERYRDAGIELPFVQDNQSRSVKGVLRGLHFQRTAPQGKLVRVSRGSVWDVAVDIDQYSPTYGQHVGVELNDENHRQMWVPPGNDSQYKCTDYYRPEDEGAVLWNDPDLNIPWPLKNPRLSDKDLNNPTLRQLFEGEH